ncbi:glycosyltransferase family 4 protein [Aestuariirhabdus litorea]|uniref:Glycosyltransferase n=1 Tax=Aestuariirhabdus litorea TaxID=2528527 RepID=A0A3P3VP66_9GAMM|nr:glycosyltransferase family 4 protein [Aestuariirhabdus litorea]RRJ84495.1 glycosyltransferase [Aestuariirhabdus litorea]RWW97720.1 glycosyltransferase [Endozoicomonadaceae bacterium GTF-13]
MLVNVISSLKGGGAELLVREINKIYKKLGEDSCAIYFCGDQSELQEGEVVFGLNPRNPVNIFRVRRVLKNIISLSDEVVVVNVNLTWPFFYVVFACIGLRNLKLVYTEHSTNNKRRVFPIVRFLDRFFYSRYSRVICISNGVRQSLAKWVGPEIAKRLVTIPNGSRIYSLPERPLLDRRLPHLISVGSLSSRKNFATSISAIAQLKDEIETYTIIGEGPDRTRLQKIIQSEQLEYKVQLLGWSDVIESHLHAADIQLIPSLWEGFGLVAVEGMSTGLPVVASNVDGLREVLGDSTPSVTLVNQPTSVNEWVSAIRKAIVDIHSMGAHSLAQSSRQQAQKFTLDKMAQSYLEVFRQL